MASKDESIEKTSNAYNSGNKSKEDAPKDKSTFLLTWELKENVSHYIVHWGASSKDYAFEHQVKKEHLIRVPRPKDNTGTYNYMIEAVDKNGKSTYSDELALKKDDEALMNRLAWVQTEFRSGVPEFDRDQGKVNVIISNQSKNDVLAVSPPVLCSEDGKEWKILVDNLDFEVGEVV
jgi:hypothetical protein